MNPNKWAIIKKNIDKTIKNLERNNMTGIFVEKKEDVSAVVEGLLKDGFVIGVGGSATLDETGILDLLRKPNYQFLDRYQPGLTPDEMKELYRRNFSADAFISSTNALTMDGELYNVDGNGNRVAPMIYGPDSVIVVAGYNKIVANIDEAVKRVNTIAAPANATRLKSGAPCIETGTCVHCQNPGRLCCSFVTLGYQRTKGRIKVLIVGEELGF